MKEIFIREHETGGFFSSSLISVGSCDHSKPVNDVYKKVVYTVFENMKALKFRRSIRV